MQFNEQQMGEISEYVVQLMEYGIYGGIEKPMPPAFLDDDALYDIQHSVHLKIRNEEEGLLMKHADFVRERGDKATFYVVTPTQNEYDRWKRRTELTNPRASKWIRDYKSTYSMIGTIGGIVILFGRYKSIAKWQYIVRDAMTRKAVVFPRETIHV